MSREARLPAHPRMDSRIKTKIQSIDLLRRLYDLLAEWLGAVRDHRQWVNSIRAKQLEDTVEVLAQALFYLGMLALIWVGYTLWYGADKALIGTTVDVPQDILEARSALGYVLVGAFAVPAVVFGVGFVMVWLYRLGRDVATHSLPRFAHCLYLPLVLLATAAALSVGQPALSGLAARVWLQGETILASAGKHQVAYPPSHVAPDSKTLPSLPASLEALRRAQPLGVVHEPPEPLSLERP